MSKDVSAYTRRELEALPTREWNSDVGVIDSLILLPLRRYHDSGYRCIDFIAVKDSKPFCRLSGCSDVLHIDGISASLNRRPRGIYSIDCLKKSGLFRIWNTDGKIEVGSALSSFEMFAVPVGETK